MSGSPTHAGVNGAMDYAGVGTIAQIAVVLLVAAIFVLHRGLATCERLLGQVLQEQEHTHAELRERAGDLDYLRAVLKDSRAHETAVSERLLQVETCVASLCLKLDEHLVSIPTTPTPTNRPEHSTSFNRHWTFGVKVQDSPRSGRRSPSAAPRPDLSDFAYANSNSWIAVLRRVLHEELTQSSCDPSSCDVELLSASSSEGVLSSNSVEKLERVLAHKHSRDDNGWVPLHACGATDNVRVATLLLENGANLNSQDITGATPLHLCASAGSVGVAKLLLDTGADAEIGLDLDHSLLHGGATPLHVCGTSDSVSVAKLLLDANADKDAQDDVGCTALHMCSMAGSVGVAELLIGAGAELEARDDQGMTPLLVCCSSDKAGVAQLLLDAGADRRAMDRLGRTVQDLCRKANSPRVSALFC
jgi:hypothetical protein